MGYYQLKGNLLGALPFKNKNSTPSKPKIVMIKMTGETFLIFRVISAK